MNNILDRPVLKLNKSWCALGTVDVRQALEDMFAGSVTALRCEDGMMIPCRLKDWIELPIRPEDEFVSTAHRRIRAPRVIIAVKFAKLIVKPPKLTKKNLRQRDEDRCIYTGKKLKPSEMSVEHLLPESLGGRTEWENVALADRELNSARGNKPLEKVGLKPRYKPFAPSPKTPAETIQNRFDFPEWVPFLKNS